MTFTTPQPSQSSRDRVIAILATLLFHLLLLVVSVYGVLGAYHSSDEGIPPMAQEDEEEITFEEVVDFVVGGNYTVPSLDPEPVPQPQLKAGAQTEAAPVPSPDPSVIQERRRQEIAKSVKFNTPSPSNEVGDGGDASETVVAASEETPDVIGLEGFSAQGFPKPAKSTRQGTIAINVTVDASGRVLTASVNHSQSTLKNDKKAEASCLDAARRSKFTPRPGTSSGATGIIVYHYNKSNNSH